MAKTIEVVVERINGIHYIPVLGDLFPKLWGDIQEVERSCHLIHTALGCWEVSAEEYASLQVGSPFNPEGRPSSAAKHR